MAYVFNSTNTGYFSNSSSFTRPLLSLNALYNTGTQNISVLSTRNLMTYSQLISSENTIINSVYLNIGYVNPDANSILTISLSAADVGDYTRTYNTSDLQKGNHISISTNSSNYWQGFNLDNINLANKQFKFTVFCSKSDDIVLLGVKSSNNYNRFFVSTAYNDFLTSFSQPILYLGATLNSLESNIQTPPIITYINDVPNTTLYGINLTNNSTLTLTGGICNILGNVNISNNSTLNAYNSATIYLSNTTRIYGYNNSNIIFNTYLLLVVSYIYLLMILIQNQSQSQSHYMN